MLLWLVNKGFAGRETSFPQVGDVDSEDGLVVDVESGPDAVLDAGFSADLE